MAHLVRSSLRRHNGASIDVDVTAAMLAEGEQECFGFTIRPCEPVADAQAAWLKLLMALDQHVGESSLATLMTQAQRLIEQRFVALAMERHKGDATAAAAALDIAVDQLLRSTVAGEAASGTPAAR